MLKCSECRCNLLLVSQLAYICTTTMHYDFCLAESKMHRRSYSFSHIQYDKICFVRYVSKRQKYLLKLTQCALLRKCLNVKTYTIIYKFVTRCTIRGLPIHLNYSVILKTYFKLIYNVWICLTTQDLVNVCSNYVCCVRLALYRVFRRWLNVRSQQKDVSSFLGCVNL